MKERYRLAAKDEVYLLTAVTLLKKVAGEESLRPAQLVSVTKLWHILWGLPRVTSGVEVTVSVASPHRDFGEIETWYWWDVGVEGEQISISSGSHFFRPSSSGDTFFTMNWAAMPEAPLSWTTTANPCRWCPVSDPSRTASPVST